jgi:hypothetical protein
MRLPLTRLCLCCAVLRVGFAGARPEDARSRRDASEAGHVARQLLQLHHAQDARASRQESAGRTEQEKGLLNSPACCCHITLLLRLCLTIHWPSNTHNSTLQLPPSFWYQFSSHRSARPALPLAGSRKRRKKRIGFIIISSEKNRRCRRRYKGWL